MQSQGFSNNQIIQTLQRDGFTSTQIFDSLNQANTQLNMPGNEGTTMEQNLPPGAPPMPPPPEANNPFPQSRSGGVESNEEIIEAIIDEKWSDLSKAIDKVIEWKDSMNSKIEKIEQRIEDLKDSYDKLHEGVIGKIGDYDKNILEVGAEVKAMEKVFSKVLPVFTENVAQLNNITERMKTTSKK